jgi:hypothetical protein
MAEALPNSVKPLCIVAHSSNSIQPPDSVISHLEIPVQPRATLAVPHLPTQQFPLTATANAATNNAPGVAPGKKQGAHAKAHRGGRQLWESFKSLHANMASQIWSQLRL